MSDSVGLRSFCSAKGEDDGLGPRIEPVRTMRSRSVGESGSREASQASDILWFEFLL